MKPDKDGIGEICTRGRNVCMGYLWDEEKTKYLIFHIFQLSLKNDGVSFKNNTNNKVNRDKTLDTTKGLLILIFKSPFIQREQCLTHNTTL